MGFITTCDVCGEPIETDEAHYRVQLESWTEPMGEGAAPVAPATQAVATLLVHKKHVDDVNAEEWLLSKFKQ